MALKDQAVLFRASHHSAALETELHRARIPYQKFGGLRFLDAAHVKDLLAFLRFANNPADRVSGLRALVLSPGIGPAAAHKILQADADQARVELLDNENWRAFKAGLAEARSAPRPATVSVARAWCEPLLQGRHDNFEQRQADLAQFEQIAAAYPSLRQFLTGLALDPIEATTGQVGKPKPEQDALVLSTIHSAKGQEWNAVFVLNVVEGALPCDRSGASPATIEEERRLLYVAMTRARDELHLLVPLRQGGRRQNGWSTGQNCGQVLTTRSRFLSQSLIHLFDAVAWPVASENASKRAAAQATRFDAASAMREMWT